MQDKQQQQNKICTRDLFRKVEQEQQKGQLILDDLEKVIVKVDKTIGEVKETKKAMNEFLGEKSPQTKKKEQELKQQQEQQQIENIENSDLGVFQRLSNNNYYRNKKPNSQNFGKPPINSRLKRNNRNNSDTQNLYMQRQTEQYVINQNIVNQLQQQYGNNSCTNKQIQQQLPQIQAKQNNFMVDQEKPRQNLSNIDVRNNTSMNSQGSLPSPLQAQISIQNNSNTNRQQTRGKSFHIPQNQKQLRSYNSVSDNNSPNNQNLQSAQNRQNSRQNNLQNNNYNEKQQFQSNRGPRNLSQNNQYQYNMDNIQEYNPQPQNQHMLYRQGNSSQSQTNLESQNLQQYYPQNQQQQNLISVQPLNPLQRKFRERDNMMTMKRRSASRNKKKKGLSWMFVGSADNNQQQQQQYPRTQKVL